MKEPSPDIIDHVIQRDIVKKLVISGDSKYSELKPAKVESNLFMYHMNKLKKAGIVTKNGNLYSLSTAGRTFVDRANLDKLKFRIQPKIITILVLKSVKGNYLILERLHEPHMNRKGFISGKIHYGERLEDSASRELKEKSGLEGIDLNLAGNICMRFLDKTHKETVSHTIGYVYTGTVYDEPIITNNSQYWKSFWAKEEELYGNDTFKGHKEILNLIKTNKMFIESFDFESDY